jgi:hypothetical protein
MGKAWFYLGLGSLILGSEALFDYLGNRWADEFSFTISAFFSIISVLVTIYLINEFAEIRLAKQEEERFKSIKKIAFRSLSQTVNDLGRRLIGPIAGVDLNVAGVPQVSKEQVQNYRKRLINFGLEPMTVSSGFWGAISTEELNDRIKVLLKDRTFSEEMFLSTSKARRELQSALAEWAPVMVRVPQAYEDLAAGWPLADKIVLLAEEWRAINICNDREEKFDSSKVLDSYSDTIKTYRIWLEDLQRNAELPTRGQYVQDRDWKS